MFGFLGKNLISSKRIWVSSPQFGFLIRFISVDSKSFAISYLINKCGLSHQKAISVPQKFHFESSTKSDKVLTLFRNNGFSDSQISKIIASRPQLLLSSVDKSLKPKFDFFNSKGLSGADLANVLCTRPNLLTCSLEKTIIPFFHLVKNIVGTDAQVITVSKRCFRCAIDAKVLASNVSLLRDHNVPASNIAKLLVLHPAVLVKKVSRFSEMVEEVEEMKFDPLEYRFLMAMKVLDSMTRSTLEAKFDVYRSSGFSLEEVQYAFRMNPFCMLISAKNIIAKMDYFVNKLGFTPSSVAKHPGSLVYSFERIVTRCSVIQVLITNGQLKKVPSLSSYLPLTEVDFFKRFISKFEKEVPELLSTYQGKGKMIGLDSSSFTGSSRE